jgi:uncharacterized protein YgiM (DUF1202 family)
MGKSRRFLFIFLFALFFCKAFSQQTYYVSYRTGLSMRKQPGVGNKVLDKIPYGTKLELIKDTVNVIEITTEGFTGYWWKVKYKNQIGYVISAYILPAIPPKTASKTLEQYFNQISRPYGKPLVLGKKNFAGILDKHIQLKKQLFNNGMEYHQVTGYEYNAELYILPGFTIEQAYLLVRLVNQFPYIIDENDPMPVNDTSFNNEQSEKSIQVQREVYGDMKQSPIKRIKIIHTEAIVTEFEIFSIDNQVAIRISSGA